MSSNDSKDHKKKDKKVKKEKHGKKTRNQISTKKHKDDTEEDYANIGNYYDFS